MEALLNLSNKRLNITHLDFERYLINEIDWNDRLICIPGSRGAGKTTLMLQHLIHTYGGSNKAVYMSLDNAYFSKNSLLETVDEFSNMGGEAVYLDEVHKYPNWSLELKNIYDEYPELKVIFSSSSMLEIYKGKGDLSRRLSNYNLAPMSLREYIDLEHKITLPTFSLEEILKNHLEISQTICKKIRPIAMYREYLEYGALPFFKDSKNKYHERLNNVINMTLEIDLPAITPTDYFHIIKIKLLLKLISEIVPFKPNISKLATKTEIDRKTVLKYLNLLDRAELIRLLKPYTKSDSIFTKPEKIYLGNPNLMFSLCDYKPDIGTLRETFFAAQLKVRHHVNSSEKADFSIDNKYTFEIGGKGKTYKQLIGVENAYIAADNIEYGSGNKIPLWLFGFLY
ncbi:MAG: AAA family ATPase [Bacteroidales bacterium]|jgi:predicted AAA+ superfamily ATPase|nr:AAA family ATPase [Bacteroidales bacterium]